MNCEKEKKQTKGIDVTACLDAVSMYNAAYHRERDNYNSSEVKHEPHIVSLGTYLWRAAMKTGTSLVGQTLMLSALLAGALIFVNGTRNLFDIARAQPTFHEEQRINMITKQPFIYTWFEPSLYPLPKDYENTNMEIYQALVLGIFCCFIGSRLSLKRARKINVGISITHADTAHLPAKESLVRASSEPARETLVRATAFPPTPPSLLLRSIGRDRGIPAEQLVRPAGRDK